MTEEYMAYTILVGVAFVAFIGALYAALYTEKKVKIKKQQSDHF